MGVWAHLGWRARVSEGECNKEPIGSLQRGFGPSGDQQPPLRRRCYDERQGEKGRNWVLGANGLKVLNLGLAHDMRPPKARQRHKGLMGLIWNLPRRHLDLPTRRLASFRNIFFGKKLEQAGFDFFLT